MNQACVSFKSRHRCIWMYPVVVSCCFLRDPTKNGYILLLYQWCTPSWSMLQDTLGFINQLSHDLLPLFCRSLRYCCQDTISFGFVTGHLKENLGFATKRRYRPFDKWLFPLLTIMFNSHVWAAKWLKMVQKKPKMEMDIFSDCNGLLFFFDLLQ